MARYKISVDRDACIGCASCTAVCPRVFQMVETPEGEKAKALITEVDELGDIREAAESCPTNAIHIDEEDNRII